MHNRNLTPKSVISASTHINFRAILQYRYFNINKRKKLANCYSVLAKFDTRTLRRDIFLHCLCKVVTQCHWEDISNL